MPGVEAVRRATLACTKPDNSIKVSLMIIGLIVYLFYCDKEAKPREERYRFRLLNKGYKSFRFHDKMTLGVGPDLMGLDGIIMGCE